jgi:hypothetical protein
MCGRFVIFDDKRNRVKCAAARFEKAQMGLSRFFSAVFCRVLCGKKFRDIVEIRSILRDIDAKYGATGLSAKTGEIAPTDNRHRKISAAHASSAVFAAPFAAKMMSARTDVKRRQADFEPYAMGLSSLGEKERNL